MIITPKKISATLFASIIISSLIPAAAFASNTSQIYVYRPSALYMGKLATYDVNVDGRNVSSVRDGSYTIVNTTPGVHTVSVYPAFIQSFTLQKTVRVALGGKVFLRVYSGESMTGGDAAASVALIATSKLTGFAGVATTQHFEMTTVPASVAMKELGYSH